MKALVETAERRSENVFLVGIELKSRSAWDVRDALEELGELATTAGARVLGSGSQKLETPNPATFVGPGKAA
ncbi:MAG: GTPase HflX, partial [Verrucomicrobiota bacterium]